MAIYILKRQLIRLKNVVSVKVKIIGIYYGVYVPFFMEICDQVAIHLKIFILCAFVSDSFT